MGNKFAKSFKPSALKLQTVLARQRVANTIKLADELKADTRQEARLAAQKCQACFYFVGIAGQAFTDQPCACCGVNQRYSTTSTDALCLQCAQEHHLCKKCGGDLEMNTDRKAWPEQPQQESDE